MSFPPLQAIQKGLPIVAREYGTIAFIAIQGVIIILLLLLDLCDGSDLVVLMKVCTIDLIRLDILVFLEFMKGINLKEEHLPIKQNDENFNSILKSLVNFMENDQEEKTLEIIRKKNETTIIASSKNQCFTLNNKRFGNYAEETKTLVNKPMSIEERRDVVHDLCKKNMPQSQIAKIVGCSQKTVSNDLKKIKRS